MKRAFRIPLLIGLLRQGHWTIPELAERFRVSESTIYRDLREIQDEPLRVPVVDRHVWYVMCGAG